MGFRVIVSGAVAAVARFQVSDAVCVKRYFSFVTHSEISPGFEFVELKEPKAGSPLVDADAATPTAEIFRKSRLVR